MDYLCLSKPGGPGSGFHLEGFPDAVKVVALTGAKPTQLAHLALHCADLLFAQDCLTALMPGQVEPMRSALWAGALVRYFKCFGSSKSRVELDPSKIYRENLLALESFEFFKNMRNKHYVHDENAFSQSLPGAVVNRPASLGKIAKIVTLSANADILGQDNFTNLRLLIEEALAWVKHEYDDLAHTLTEELELKPHGELLALPDLAYSKPDASDVALRRKS